jgi:hypothetical protein
MCGNPPNHFLFLVKLIWLAVVIVFIVAAFLGIIIVVIIT